MAVDIFAIEPHKVSRDMRGYIVTFYGEPKSGKTTTAVQFPNHLLLAFEKGYNAIPGAKALPMNKWSDLIQVIRQLDKPEAKEMYETIIVDTADIAYELCTKHVLNREGVQNVKDIPYGGGYAMIEKEFDARLRELAQMGYGVVMISHSTDKTFKDEAGEEYNQIVTTLDKRANKIVGRMSDIIGYSRNVPKEDGTGEEVRLFMRGTTRFVAGSRFPDTPTSIVFNYDNLVKTIGDAVDKLEERFGSGAVTEEVSNLNAYEKNEVPVEDLIAKFNEKATYLMEANADFFGPRIVGVVEETFGIGAKIGEATPAQADLVELSISSLEELAEQYKDRV